MRSDVWLAPSVSRRSLLGAGAAILGSGCGGAPRSDATAGSASATRARLLDPHAFAQEVDKGDRFVLNVHVPDDGSLPGTDRAVAFDELRERWEELPAVGTAMAVYCRTGNMSEQAVPELAAMGFDDIVELRGGMVAWQEAGLPLLPAGAVGGYTPEVPTE